MRSRVERLHLQHHAEVQEDDRAVLLHQDVAGVRIGVEEALHQHHPQVGLHEVLHHPREGDRPRRELLVQPVHLGAMDELRHQHPPARERVDHPRGAHPRVGGEDLAEALGVPRLFPQIRLLADPALELAEDGREGPDVVVREEDVQEEEDAEGDVEVERDEGLDTGAEHLHRYVLAPGDGAVHLPQRRGGDGDAVEALEGLAHRAAELRHQHGLDRLHRHRRDGVLEAADLAEVGLRDDVGAGGETCAILMKVGPSEAMASTRRRARSRCCSRESRRERPTSTQRRRSRRKAARKGVRVRTMCHDRPRRPVRRRGECELTSILPASGSPVPTRIEARGGRDPPRAHTRTPHWPSEDPRFASPR